MVKLHNELYICDKYYVLSEMITYFNLPLESTTFETHIENIHGNKGTIIKCFLHYILKFYALLKNIKFYYKKNRKFKS
jgi:hypothetical protein